jgi:hypothetical protein
MPKPWTVKKRAGTWRVYDRGVWHDTFDTLEEAHTYATQNAVADALYQPGGLSLLAEMKGQR